MPPPESPLSNCFQIVSDSHKPIKPGSMQEKEKGILSVLGAHEHYSVMIYSRYARECKRLRVVGHRTMVDIGGAKIWLFQYASPVAGQGSTSGYATIALPATFGVVH